MKCKIFMHDWLIVRQLSHKVFSSDSQMMNYFHLADDLALVLLRAISTMEFLPFLHFFSRILITFAIISRRDQP